jgi:hypothetical protein
MGFKSKINTQEKKDGLLQKKIVILFPDKCFVSITSGARNKHAISTKCIFYEETTKYFCKSICSVKNILKHIQRGNNFQSQRIAKVHSGR